MRLITIRPKIGAKIETQERLPVDDRQSAIDEAMSRRGVYGSEFTAPMLGQDAEEAQRLTYAGRSVTALQEARTFDLDRAESMPLFQNTKRQKEIF